MFLGASRRLMSRKVATALWLLLMPQLGMSAQATSNAITTVPFGKMPDGTSVELYVLRNHRGMEAKIATYGGVVTSLTAPDRNGRYRDVVLGYDTLEGYVSGSSYFGALIGRYGNRISKGKF